MTSGRQVGGGPFAAFLEQMPDAIIGVDRDSAIMLVNARAASLFGFDRAEIIGKPLELLLPGYSRDTTRPEKASQGGDPSTSQVATVTQLAARRKDRSLFPAEVVFSSTRRYGDVVVMAAVRDTTERVKDPVRFHGVVEAVDDAAVGVDRSGLIALVNPQAEELFGYTRRELIDQPFDLLVPQAVIDGSGRPGPNRLKTKANGQLTMGTPLEGRRKDGSAFPVEISLSAVETEEGPLVSAAIRDASDRPETRREQDRAAVQGARDLLESRLHQSHRLESLGQLAGGVAHDFNNLLAAILNYVGFVSDEISKEIDLRPASTTARLTAVLRDVGQIGAAAERAAGLTHQLLAFARREVRNLEVLDLNGIVGEVETLLRRTIGEHVLLTTDGASDLKGVRADRGQMEQILLNLAVNARDAMPNGGTLSVATENFTVDDAYATLHPVIEAGSYVRLTVTDTGEGMDRETLDRAFEPFFSTKPKDKGTGLGLATVYGIVSQTGGMIELRSEVEDGTTVTILLPSVTAAVTRNASPQIVRRHRTGETILVVEDEELVRDVASRILTQHGYHVLLAAGGSDAFALNDAHPGVIDLLLTDVVMPGVTGREVAERMSEARPDIRVLYMSGYQDSVIAARGVIEQGITLLSKPFKASDLVEHVRAVLDA
jgi:PAS domain S-box-containing protein